MQQTKYLFSSFYFDLIYYYLIIISDIFWNEAFSPPAEYSSSSSYFQKVFSTCVEGIAPAFLLRNLQRVIN